MNDDGYLDHQAMHGTLYSNRLDLTDVTRLPFTATMEMGNTPKPNTVGATGAFTVSLQNMVSWQPLIFASQDPSEIGVALQKRATSLDVDDHDALRDEAGEVAEKSAEMERRLLQATTAKQARQKGWSIKDVLLAAAVVLGSKVKGIIDKMPHHHRA